MPAASPAGAHWSPVLRPPIGSPPSPAGVVGAGDDPLGMVETVDRLFVHCRELVTLTDGPALGPRRGADMQRLGVIADGAIAVRDGRVLAVGPTESVARDYRAAEELDLGDFVVMPGFVDCHTHPVFARTREEEFHMRCAGADYMAIAAAGGGILSSMRAVREATQEDLAERTEQHLWGFLQNGITTVECKSGYGLSLEDEEKSLRALATALEEVPLNSKRTFLGAHEFPPDYRDDRDAYVRLVCEEMMPRLASLADYCDVFAEPGVFDLAQSRRVLRAGSTLCMSDPRSSRTVAAQLSSPLFFSLSFVSSFNSELANFVCSTWIFRFELEVFLVGEEVACWFLEH